MYQTRHSGASIDPVQGFRTLQKNPEIDQQCRKMRHGQLLGGRLPLSLSRSETSWKHSYGMSRYCGQSDCESISSQTYDWKVYD